MNTQVDIENKVKAILKKVLDVKDDEINANESLAEGLDVDSTEMVEISVGIKKELNVLLKDNELKKSHSLNEIVGIIKSKTEDTGGCGGHSCGCKH